MPDAIDIYNAIGAKFDQIGADSGGVNNRWEFQFDQNKNNVLMNVYLGNRDSIFGGDCSSLLSSSLNKNDVSQLIQWLFKVKSCIKD